MSNFSFMSIIELLRSDGSIIINKKLNFSLGTHTTIVYTELLSRFMYFLEKDQLTEDGYFFNTVDDLKLGTGLGKTAQTNAINDLIDKGLIKKDLRGIPPKRYFKIIPDTELIEKYLQEGAKEMEKLRGKQSTKAVNSKIAYSKRLKEYAASDSNSMSQACNNTNSSNNTKENNTNKTYRTPKKNSLSMSIFLSLYKKYTGEKHKAVEKEVLREAEDLMDIISNERISEDHIRQRFKQFFEEFTSKNDNSRLPTLNYFLEAAPRHFTEEWKAWHYH